MRKKISITISEQILKDIDAVIDFVYIRNRSQAIEHLVSNSLGQNKTCVILAGGPESQLQVGHDFCLTAKTSTGKKVIERQLATVRSNGFRKIILIARRPIINAVFESVRDGTEYGVKIEYIEEKTSKGTADSLRLIKGKIDANFLVVYGDVLFEKINLTALWNEHIKQGRLATIMMTTAAKPSEKGTLKVEGSTVLEFTQKPSKSDIYLVFSPIFVATPELVEQEGNSLETTVFPELAKKNLLTGHLSSEKETHIHTLKDAKLA